MTIDSGNYYTWLNDSRTTYIIKTNTKRFYTLYYLFENVEQFFYDNPEEEAKLSEQWEKFKDALRNIIELADEAAYYGRDDPPERPELATTNSVGYLLGYYTRVAEGLIGGIDKELDWFNELEDTHPCYSEYKEAHLHYRRALKFMSNLSV